MNLAHVIDYWSRWQPEACAIRFGEQSVTWRELDERASAVASALQDLGVAPGDRVGLLMLNRPEFLSLLIAAMRLGAVVVPLNVRLTRPELTTIITNAGCRVLVTEDALVDRVDGLGGASGPMPVLRAEEFDGLTAASIGPIDLEPDRCVPIR